MNLLMFNYEYPPIGGGGGVTHALVAEELARRHRVLVITSAFADLPVREVREGVEIHRVPVLGRSDRSAASLASLLSFPPSAWVEAARVMRRETFDVINSHFAVPTGPGSLPAARLARIPHVVSLHGGDIFDPSKRISPHRLPVVRHVVTWVLKNSAAVVAQSTDTRANAYRYTGYRGPIEIIPLGIRKPQVPQASRSELGLPPEGFLAVTVGRLVRRKGLDQLFSVLARAESSSVRLVVIGEGPELESLRGLASRLGIAERVLFTGWVDEVRKWQILACADAYLSATMHEGFGLVYLEAISSGLPIITSNHGGQVDFLRDGETGFLVPPGDERALAEALRWLTEHPHEARRMGETNLARSLQHRAERCAQSYEALFETVSEKGPLRPRSRASTTPEPTQSDEGSSSEPTRSPASA